MIPDGVMKAAGAALRKAIRDRVVSQGHDLTGKLWQDIEERIEIDGMDTVLVGELVDYARHVEYGVPAERIPFTLGSGAGRSLYIEALARYAEMRGMERPKSAAFAIAMKHKKEGMPTQASSRFSQDGNRTGFLERAIEESKDDVERIIFAGVGDVIKVTVSQMIEKTQIAWDSV